MGKTKGSSKKKKKEEKLVARAARAHAASVVGVEVWDEKTDVPAPNVHACTMKRKDAKDLVPAVLLQRFRSLDARCLEFYREAHGLTSDELNQRAGVLMEEVGNFMNLTCPKDETKHHYGVLTLHFIYPFVFGCQARLNVASAANRGPRTYRTRPSPAVADLYQSAIDAASNGIKISGLIEKIRRDRQHIEKDDDTELRYNEFLMYANRGRAQAILGEYDGAVCDLRASAVLGRRLSLGDDPSQQYLNVLDSLVGVMALSKLDEPRPHYTTTDRQKFNKELRLHEYAPSFFKCHGCGRTEPAVTLRKCSRCNGVFYCGPSCQRSDWVSHKSHCHPAMTSSFEIPLSQRDAIDASIDQNGFIVYYTTGGPFAVLRDPSTRHLFVSLTDEPCSFSDDIPTSQTQLDLNTIGQNDHKLAVFNAVYNLGEDLP